MAIANTRVHIICGMCGSKDHMSYEIKENWICDNEGVEHQGVVLRCGNCASITGLEELMKEKKKK
jgi:hypothetical protein